MVAQCFCAIKHLALQDVERNLGVIINELFRKVAARGIG